MCFGRLPAAVDYVMPSVMDYVPGDPKPGLFVRDEGHGQCIVSLHSNEALEPPVDDPDSYVESVDGDFVERCAGRLLERFPDLDDLGLTEGWTGLYPVSPDGNAIVGPNPSRAGVIDAGGLGGVGIMLSPAIGRIVAEWIVFGEPRAVEGADVLLGDRFADRGRADASRRQDEAPTS